MRSQGGVPGATKPLWIQAFDLTGKPTRKIAVPALIVDGAQWAPDGRRLITWSNEKDGGMRVYDTVTGKVVTELPSLDRVPRGGHGIQWLDADRLLISDWDFGKGSSSPASSDWTGGPEVPGASLVRRRLHADLRRAYQLTGCGRIGPSQGAIRPQLRRGCRGGIQPPAGGIPPRRVGVRTAGGSSARPHRSGPIRTLAGIWVDRQVTAVMACPARRILCHGDQPGA